MEPHFEQFVRRTESCWFWTGGHDKDGYGLYRPPGSKRKYRAHRYVLLVEGIEPEFVCHTCDNSSCVRRDHLFEGNAQANYFDMVAKGRRSHHRSNAKLTEEGVVSIRDRYAAGGVTMAALAAEYHVTKAAIQLAIEHRSWRSVGGYRRPTDRERR